MNDYGKFLIFLVIIAVLFMINYSLCAPELAFKLENLKIKYNIESKYLSPYDFYYYVNGTGYYSFIASSFVLEVSNGTVKAIYERNISQTRIFLNFYVEHTSGRAFLEVSGNGFNHTFQVEKITGYKNYSIDVVPGDILIIFKLHPENGIGRLRVGNIFFQAYNESTTTGHVAVCQLDSKYCKHTIETPVLAGEGLLELPTDYRNITIDGSSATYKVFFNTSTQHVITAYTVNDLKTKISSNGVEDRFFKPGSEINIEINPVEAGNSTFKLYKNGGLIVEETWSEKCLWSFIGELGEYRAEIAWKGRLYCGFQSAEITVTDFQINHTITGKPIVGLPVNVTVNVLWLHNNSLASGVIAEVDGIEKIVDNGVVRFQISSSKPGRKTYYIRVGVKDSNLSNEQAFNIEWVGFEVPIIDVKNGTLTQNRITVEGSDTVELFFSIRMTNGTIPNGMKIILDEAGETATVTDGKFSFKVTGLENITLLAIINHNKVEIAKYEIVYIYPGIKIFLDDYYFQVGSRAEFKVRIVWMHNDTPIKNAVVHLGDFETTVDESGYAVLEFGNGLGEHYVTIEAEITLNSEKITIKRIQKIVFTYIELKTENSEITTKNDEVSILVSAFYGHDHKPIGNATIFVEGKTLKTDQQGKAIITLKPLKKGENTFTFNASKGRIKTLNPLTVKVYKVEASIEKIETNALYLKMEGEHVLIGAPGTLKTLRLLVEGAEKLVFKNVTATLQNGVVEFNVVFPSNVGISIEKIYVVERDKKYPLAIVKIVSAMLNIEEVRLQESNMTHWIIGIWLYYEPVHVPAANVTVQVGEAVVKTDENGYGLFIIKRKPAESLKAILVQDPLGIKNLENNIIANITKIRLEYFFTGKNTDLKIALKAIPPVKNLKILYDKKQAITNKSGIAIIDYNPGIEIKADPSSIENAKQLYYAYSVKEISKPMLDGSLNVTQSGNQLIVKAEIYCRDSIAVENLRANLTIIEPNGEKITKTYVYNLNAKEKALIDYSIKISESGEYAIYLSAEAENLIPVEKITRIEATVGSIFYILIAFTMLMIIFVAYFVLKKRQKRGNIFEDFEF